MIVFCASLPDTVATLQMNKDFAHGLATCIGLSATMPETGSDEWTDSSTRKAADCDKSQQ